MLPLNSQIVAMFHFSPYISSFCHDSLGWMLLMTSKGTGLFSQCYPQFRKLTRNWKVFVLIQNLLDFFLFTQHCLIPVLCWGCSNGMGLEHVTHWHSAQSTTPRALCAGCTFKSQGRSRETETPLKRLFWNIGPPQFCFLILEICFYIPPRNASTLSGKRWR